jgi:hypothetical protein
MVLAVDSPARAVRGGKESRLVVAISVSLLLSSSAGAQGRSQTNPCMTSASSEPALRPVDEASRRPDFLEFRRQLQDAVARRDEAAVLASVHPSVRTSFGDSGGLDVFRKEHIHGKEGDFWQEFATILRLGGSFRLPAAFDAPYTFSVWPGDLDSFECLAVVGTRVRVRAEPSLKATVLTHLDYKIVRALGTTGPAGWRRVGLADGRTGFIAARYVRSPIDHRALFQYENGRWWLMAYVAGD